MRAYKLEDGRTVFPFTGFTYGCITPEGIAVTEKQYGGYPFFEIIKDDIVEELSVERLPFVDDDHAKKVCKTGQGSECCKYLTMGYNGWSCEKLTTMGTSLKDRIGMTAKGDNCDGRAPRQ